MARGARSIPIAFSRALPHSGATTMNICVMEINVGVVISVLASEWGGGCHVHYVNGLGGTAPSTYHAYSYYICILNHSTRVRELLYHSLLFLITVYRYAW